MGLFQKVVNNKKILLTTIVLICTVVFFISNFVIGTVLTLFNYFGDMLEGKKDVSFDFQLNTIWQFQSEQLMFYIIIYLLVFIILGKIYFNFKLNFSDLDEGQHGTRNFETVENLKKQYKIIPSKDEEYEGHGGVIIAGLNTGNNDNVAPEDFKHKKYQLLIDEAPVHTMVIGITRSGKGETFVVPMIDVQSRAKIKPSMVVNDPKGELAGASYETLIKRGYDVHIYNLMQQDMGMGFNPLQLVIDSWKKGDYANAVQYTDSIGHTLYYDPNAKDPFWTQSASSLVKAIILAIVEDSVDKGEEHKINMYSVAIFLSTLGSDNNEKTGENALDLFFKAREVGNPAKEMYATANFSEGSARGSIFAIAMSELQIFTSEPNARLTSYNSLDLTDVGFGDKPIAIFMVTPDYDSSNHVLASIFVSQLYRVNAEKATKETGKMERHVHFMLDEFGNMPTIEGMESMVTVGAGRGFRFHLIIQSYSQVDGKYGDKGASTIKGNCSNQIYILTQDKTTAEEFSSQLGTKTITDVSRSGHLHSTSKTHSESTKERPLLFPNELLELNLGESVVMRVNKREDLERKKIKPKPIYNSLESSTFHHFRFRYLADDFDTDNSILTLPISSEEYHAFDLEEITFISELKDDDCFIPFKKLMTKREVVELRKKINFFNGTVGQFEKIEEYSPLHLLSYIVFELRPSLDYFKEQYDSGSVRIPTLNLKSFCTENVLKTWELRLENVLEEKGVNLESPSIQNKTMIKKNTKKAN